MGSVDPAIEKTGGVTHKSDIYSFGVVLFEILCEKKALIHNEANRSLAQLAKYHYEKGTLHDIIHPCLLNQMLSPQSLLIYSKVAYSCLNDDRANRPDMHYIVAKLEKALELQLRRENIVRHFFYFMIYFFGVHHSCIEIFLLFLYLYFLLYLKVSENRMTKEIQNEQKNPKYPGWVTWLVLFFVDLHNY
ncbi:putative protein kinase RLK-Pelle-LRR-I-1 family [Helianthus debilis subsp. tardiflorus]